MKRKQVMTIMSVGVGNCGCSDFAHIVMYNAFYTQPGRIKAARKVGAGEAEALREKVSMHFQEKYSDNYIFLFRLLGSTPPTVLLWQLTGSASKSELFDIVRRERRCCCVRRPSWSRAGATCWS